MLATSEPGQRQLQPAAGVEAAAGAVSRQPDFAVLLDQGIEGVGQLAPKVRSEAAQRLVATQPTYLTGYAYIAMNAVALGRLEEARTAITEGRRVQPDLSLDLMQNYFGVSRPTIDARRNAALREAGLE